MGAIYAVLFRADQASTWAQTRPEALSITQAPESPPTRRMSVVLDGNKSKPGFIWAAFRVYEE